MIHILLTSRAPSSHWVWAYSYWILNAKRAPEMWKILRLRRLYVMTLYKDPTENNLICIILHQVLTALTFALKSRKFGIRCSRFGIEIKFVFLFSISQIIDTLTTRDVLGDYDRVSQWLKWWIVMIPIFWEIFLDIEHF